MEMTTNRLPGNWNHANVITSHSYVCGHCGDKVGPDKGYTTQVAQASSGASIMICSSCNRPTFFFQSEQVPSSAFGASVDHVPKEISALYDEARRCMKVEAFTCAVLGLRTLLSHIAVERGAEQGWSFSSYVRYLTENGLAPTGSAAWIDSIRERGNEAAHDLEIMERNAAEQVISFAEMILKFIYEFPARVMKPSPSPSAQR